MARVRRKSTNPNIEEIIPTIVKSIGELPVGGRPPFAPIGAIMGEGMGVWVGINMVIVGEGNKVGV